MQVYFEFISVTSFSVAPLEWFQLPFWQVVGVRIQNLTLKLSVLIKHVTVEMQIVCTAICPCDFWAVFRFQLGVITVTECPQGRGHITARWLALACVSGNSWDSENTCSVSPSKSFSTCVRYIICCWLWASCHLPPIKTPLCNSAPFSQRTRSWQNTVQHTPLTAFTHFHPSWGLSVGSADTGSAVGRTTPRRCVSPLPGFCWGEAVGSCLQPHMKVFPQLPCKRKIKKNERPANSIYLMSQNQFHFGFLALGCALDKHCGQTEVQ